MAQVEVRPYIRSDGVRVEGYVRNLPYNASAATYVQTSQSKKGKTEFQVAGRLRSDLGEASFIRKKSGKVSYRVEPNIGGITSAIGSFLRQKAAQATDAPGTVADAASQAAQGVRTSTDAVIPTEVSPGVRNAAVAAAVVGAGFGVGTVAVPALAAGMAATPAAVTAGAAGTALVTSAPATAGLLPATSALVASKGGAITMMSAMPSGATTVAGAIVPPALPGAAAATRQAAQTVVPMVGSQGKFKVIDAAGKTLMSGLTKKQAAQMAAQFGQIL